MRLAASGRVRGLIAALVAVFWLTACGQQSQVATPVPAVATPVATATVVAALPTVPSEPTAAATAVPTQVATAVPAGATVASIAPTPAPAIAPTRVPTPAAVTLLIPKINVTAPIEDVGLTPDGAMDVPKKVEDVGWFAPGYVPGTPGNAVMAGHLDSTVAPAIFWRLNELNVGDKVVVVRADHSQLTFDVTGKVSYPYNEGPIDKIFGPATTANLNLITCGGSWDYSTKNYSNRLVVYTTLAG